MEMRLALMIDARPEDCTIRWIDTDQNVTAQYSLPVRNRIKLCPQQLVAVHVATTPPSVVWRWFRGVVIYRRADYVVVDNHVYQAGFRFPISVVHLPDILEDDVQIGDEVFYSVDLHGAVIDTLHAGRPAHPARIGHDLFPAISEVYAEHHNSEEA
ncbi:MAG: hypothetical protein HC828_05145 [Blastochloris sp.]|nr:hypothetical protein [Blastochloris sp.]